MTLRLFVALVSLGGLAAAPAASQELRPLDERVSTAPGYFTYALPGERTTQATVIGTVRAPGLYVVSAGTDLAELVALAGGPVLNALSSEVDRTVTVRLYRADQSGTRAAIYDQTVEAFAADGDGYPVVLDGDMVEVTTFERRRRSYRDTLTIVGGVSTAVIAVVQLFSVLR